MYKLLIYRPSCRSSCRSAPCFALAAARALPYNEGMQATQLTMLGTGNAAVTRCFNTCFALRTAQGVLLTDAGGGNGILSRLEKAGIALNEIHELFVTHAHTDHILGVIWVVRMVGQLINAGKYEGELCVYGHDAALEVVDWVCRHTLPGKVCCHIGGRIRLIELKDGETFAAAGMEGLAFDIGSDKAKQFGYRLRLPDGRILVCLGDEPFNERNREVVQGADWLLSEAFCLAADAGRFKPYEKHHSTARDAGRLAAELGVCNLLLYHTEDKSLATRRATYTAEAAESFRGRIEVPEDGETISL